MVFDGFMEASSAGEALQPYLTMGNDTPALAPEKRCQLPLRAVLHHTQDALDERFVAACAQATHTGSCQVQLVCEDGRADTGRTLIPEPSNLTAEALASGVRRGQ